MKEKKIKILTGILILSMFLFTALIKSSNLDIEKVELTTGLHEIKTSQVEVFHDDINTSYWNLVDVSYSYFEKPESQQHDYLLDYYTTRGIGNYTGVSYYVGDQDIFPEGFSWDGTNWWMIGSDSDKVYKYYSNWTYTGVYYDIVGQCSTPTGIFWDGTNWWMVGDGVFDRVYKYNSDWSYTGISYFIHDQEPAPKGIYWDGTNWWMVGLNDRVVYKYHSNWSYTGISHYIGDQDGYPSDLFWDATNWWVPGIYTDIVHQYDSDWSYTGNSYYLGGLDDYPTDIFWKGINWWMLGYENSRVYEYSPKFYDISKYYFGNGYMYMQTNTTETIALQSVDYVTQYNLSSGYYFRVEFETNSDSQIDLILLKGGIISETLILSQSGNTDFSNHTIQIFIDKNMEFDQLKISGALEDTDYVKIYDIKIEKLEIVGEDLNIKIIAIIIGATFLGLGVSLAVIFITKVKSKKSGKPVIIEQDK